MKKTDDHKCEGCDAISEDEELKHCPNCECWWCMDCALETEDGYACPECSQLEMLDDEE